MITIAQAQSELDLWWNRGERIPNLDDIAAFICRRWSGVDAGKVRVRLIDGADLQGPAIEIELEKLDGALIIRQLRPTNLTRQDGITLDDVVYLGATRRWAAKVAASQV